MLNVMHAADHAVLEAVRLALPALTALVDVVAERLERGGRLIYLGAGTSGRLGVLDASECPPTFHTDPSMVVGLIAGGDSALRRSSEGREDEWHGAAEALDALAISGRDVVVGIAAGGTTPYVWGAIARAQRVGAATALLTCVRYADARDHVRHGFPDAGEPGHVVELVTGPEVVTGSTRMKAGTATKLALNMISTAAMVKLGKVWGHLMVDVRATNAKLHDRAVRTLRSQLDLDDDRAAALLDAAAGSVKTALVMARLNLDRSAAEQALHQHAGRLRPLLGAPR